MLNTIAGLIAARMSDMLTFAVLLSMLWIIYPHRCKKASSVGNIAILAILGLTVVVLLEKATGSYWVYFTCFPLIGLVYGALELDIHPSVAFIFSVVFATAYFQLAILEEWIVVYYLSAWIPAWRAMLSQFIVASIFFGMRAMLRNVAHEHCKPLPSYCALIVLTSLISFIISSYFISAGVHAYTPEDMSVRAALSLLAGAVNLMSFYLYHRLILNQRNERRLHMLRLRQELDRRMAEEVLLSNKRLQKSQHDIKHHFVVLRIMAEKNEYREAIVYIDQFLSQHLEADKLHTGNPAINAIVGQKLSLAKQNNIPFEIDIPPLPLDLPIADIDICSLLGNLLDNALEASARTLQASIVIKMKMKGNGLAIKVINRIQGDVLQANPTLQTIKHDKGVHGWGLPSVRSVAEKYAGDLHLSVHDGLFEASVILFFVSTKWR